MMNQKDRIIEMHTDIRWIKKALSGNGSKGLLEEVKELQNWRAYTIGIVVALSVVIKVVG